jgi:hypothetical protein
MLRSRAVFASARFVASRTVGVIFVALLAACGSVDALPSPDAPMPDAVMPDAWQQSCKLSVPLITTIDAATPGYGNSCLHGTWNLQAFNGTTMPPTAGQDGGTVIVRPAAIALGFNTLDPTSTFAIHVSGSGQENNGTMFSYAQLSAPLNTIDGGQVGTVDASAYTGVQFYAIINTAPTGARLRVADLYTDPSGGMCSTAGGPSGCYDHPAAQLTPSTTWTKYQVPFATLTQAGFGNPSPIGTAFPSNAILVVRWDINVPATGPTAPWEFWIDDVTFY